MDHLDDWLLDNHIRRNPAVLPREVENVGRKACRATGVARSTVTYRARRPAQDALRRRLRELAQARVSFGYRRLYVLLCRDGWRIILKRGRRLYPEEGLCLLRRRPARRKSAATRSTRVPPAGRTSAGRWTSWPTRSRTGRACASSH